MEDKGKQSWHRGTVPPTTPVAEVINLTKIIVPVIPFGDLARRDDECGSKRTSVHDMVGDIVHEIGSPLDGAARFVNLAYHSLPGESPVKRYLEKARFGLAQIATITRSLLDFYRGIDTDDTAVDVHDLIEESLQLFDHYVTIANVQVVRAYNAAIPPVMLQRLRLVFNNIIKNACDAMPAGGKLYITTQANEGVLIIAFRDTGPGVAPEVAPRLFRPFLTTKGGGNGIGLGLALSREIVNSYNGTLTLENSPHGATFSIAVPYTAPEKNDAVYITYGSRHKEE